MYGSIRFALCRTTRTIGKQRLERWAVSMLVVVSPSPQHVGDARQGLFAAAPEFNLSTPFYCYDASGNERMLDVRRALFHEIKVALLDNTFDEDHPLMSRGWMYQERLLSPRVLHFGATELVWECREATLCECGVANGSSFVFKLKPGFHIAVHNTVQTSEEIVR